MLNIVDSIRILINQAFNKCLLGMLNIVDSIHNYLGESINGCLLGMLNIVDSIRTGNNKKALIKFARYVKYSG